MLTSANMPRPKEFDVEQALEAAMHAFWRNGYEGTSTEALCEATGLRRSSLYNTFKTKRDLFHEALRRYVDTATARHIALLDGPGTPTEKIDALLREVLADECSSDRRGCLAVNTAIELGGKDDACGKELDRDMRLLIEALHTTIDTGQRDGEFGTGTDARALAEFVHATLGGLRVQARAGATKSTLDNVVQVALHALRR